MQVSEKDEIIQTITQTMLVLFDGLENKIDKEMLIMKKQLKEIPIMKQQIEELKNSLSETNKEVRKISKSVAVIEHEHGDKLKMLFDAVTMNSQKISEQGKEIKKLFELYQNHDDRIYLLESKVQGR